MSKLLLDFLRKFLHKKEKTITINVTVSDSIMVINLRD